MVWGGKWHALYWEYQKSPNKNTHRFYNGYVSTWRKVSSKLDMNERSMFIPICKLMFAIQPVCE